MTLAREKGQIWPVDSVDCCTDYTNQQCLLVCQGWLFVIRLSSNRCSPRRIIEDDSSWAFETAHSKGVSRSKAPLSGCTWTRNGVICFAFTRECHGENAEYQKLETWLESLTILDECLSLYMPWLCCCSRSQFRDIDVRNSLVGPPEQERSREI